VLTPGTKEDVDGFLEVFPLPGSKPLPQVVCPAASSLPCLIFYDQACLMVELPQQLCCKCFSNILSLLLHSPFYAIVTINL